MRRISHLLVALAILMGALVPGVLAFGAEPPALSIQFDKGTYHPGETATVTIGISNVPVGVMESATVEMHYDAGVFDAPLTSPADEESMRQGSALPNSTFIIQHFPGAVSISMSDPGLATSTGTLLTLKFPIKAYVPDGHASIRFAAVTPETENGVLFLDGAPTPSPIAEGVHTGGTAKIFLGGTLSGTVGLAGRQDQDYSGITVSVPSANQSAVTDASGTFSIPDLPQGIHEVRFSKLGYLSARLNGVIILRGGGFDVNGQNIQLIPGNIRDTAVGPDVIFLEDLAGLARAIGSVASGTSSFGGVWDPLADLDATGDVGGSDLGILATNWALRGPGSTTGSPSPGTVFQVRVPTPAATTLTLSSNLSSVQHSDRVTLTATLSAGASGLSLAHKEVHFQVGTQVIRASTDANGQAVADAYVDLAAGGPYALTASFAGDPLLAPSSGQAQVSVTPETATLHYLGPDLVSGGLNVIEIGVSQEQDGSWAHFSGLQVQVTVTPAGETALQPVTANVDPYTGKAIASFTLPHKGAAVSASLVANGYFAASTLAVNVPRTNLPPFAAADSYSAVSGKSLEIASGTGVLLNDVDDDGDPLSATLVSGPAPGTGTVVLNSDGSFIYTPPAGFVGAATFTYTVFDGFVQATPTHVVIDVTNQPPVALDDYYVATANHTLSVATPTGVLANDHDPDQHPLTVVPVSLPATGSFTLQADGSLSYTPPVGFVGWVYFEYVIHDGFAPSATATGTIEVVNQPPVGATDTFSILEDTPLTVTAAGLLANDHDPDGHSPLQVMIWTDPAHGTLVASGTGSWIYTPNLNATGTDSFQYVVSDGIDESMPVLVKIAITAVNDAPTVAAPEFRFTDEDISHAFDAIVGDVDDASLTVQLDSVGGTLDLMPSGSVTITAGATGSFSITLSGPVVDLNATLAYISFLPLPDSTATGTVTISVKDAGNLTASATTTITVNPVNDEPTAMPDSYTVLEDGSITVDVLSNDSTLPDVGETLSIFDVGFPDHGGAVTWTGTLITYAPAPNFSGTETFIYTITDGNGGYASATATMTVTAVNDGPSVTAPQFRSIFEDGVDYLDYTVSDVDHASLTVHLDAVNGTLDLTLTGTATLTGATGTGSLTVTGTVAELNEILFAVAFMPLPDSAATGTVTITVTDGDGALSSGVTTITVTEVNDEPTAQDDSYSVPANGGPYTLNVLANDSTSPDTGETLALVGVPGSTAGGAVSISGSDLLYTPQVNFAGMDSIEYTVEDGRGGYATATATITVSGTPSGLSAGDLTVAEGGTAGLTATLSGVSPLDGREIHFSVGGFSVGTATTDASGTATLNYTVSELSGTYTIGAEFKGAEGVLGSSASGTLTVYMATNLDLTFPFGTQSTWDDPRQTAVSLTAGTSHTPIGSATVTFTLVDDTNQTVATFTGTTDASGLISWTHPPTYLAGTFKVVATFAGDGLYDPASGTGTLTYSAASTYFPAFYVNGDGLGPTSTTLSEPVSISATLMTTGEEAIGDAVPLRFEVLDSSSVVIDQFYATTNNTGSVSTTFTLSNTGTYFIRPVFDGNANLNAATGTSIQVDVSTTTVLTVAPVSGVYSDQVTLSATLSPATAGLTVSFSVNGMWAGDTTTDGSGVASRPYIIVQASGTYSIDASFAGTTYYQASSNSNSLTVAKENATLTYTGDTVVTANLLSLTAALTQEADGHSGDPTLAGTVTFEVRRAADNSLVDAQTMSVGFAETTGTTSVPLNNEPHLVTVSLDSNGYYEASTVTATVQEIPVVTVSDVAGASGDTVTLGAALTSFGGGLAGRELTFSVDGVLAGTGVTDATGQATTTFTISQGSGTFAVLAEFAGETYYTAASDTGTLTVLAPTAVTVSPVNAYLSQLTTLTANLSPAVSGLEIKFSVDGVFVGTSATDASGTATVPFTTSANLGDFTILAEFAGDGTYAASSGSNTLANREAAFLSASNIYAAEGGSTYLKAALTDSSGESGISGKEIGFQIDGVTVATGLTNSFGNVLVTYPVTQASGTYTLTRSFAGDSQYGPTQTTASFVVSLNTHAPTATWFPISTSTGLTVTFTLEGVDQEGNLMELAVPSTTDQGGSLSLVANSYSCGAEGAMYCSADYTYTPPASFAGTDTFTFIVDDGALTSSWTVSITVTDPTAPTALGDSYAVAEDTTLTVDTLAGVLANDTDLEASVLTAVKVSDPANGTLILVSDGSFTYTPSANFYGRDSFTYQAFDGFNYSGSTTVTLDVIAQTTLSVGSLSAVTGEAVTLTGTLSPAEAGLEISFTVDGAFAGTATTDASGTASLPYTVSQSSGTYSILAEFAGTAGYLASSGTGTLTVSDATALAVSFPGGSSSAWDSPLQAQATLTHGGAGVSGATITFTLLDSTSQMVDQFSLVTDGSGVATWTHTVTYRSGDFTVTAAFAGDGSAAPASASGTISYTAVDTFFSAFYVGGDSVGPVSTLVGEALSISAHLLTSSETSINDTVNLRFEVADSVYVVIDQFYATTNTSGNGSTSFALTSTGTYHIRPVFDGNPNLNAATGTWVQVDVSEETLLTVDSLSGSTNDVVTLTATLTPALSGEEISFTVDGAFAGSALTDASGTATLAYTVTQGSGSYFIVGTFAGSGSYLASTGTGTLTVTSPTTLTVSPVAGYVTQAATLTATLSPALSAREITFSVNGAFAGTAATDASGTATLVYTIVEAAGSYPILAEFAGDGSYGASSGSSTLTVSLIPASIWPYSVSTVESATIYLEADLSDGLNLTGLSGREVTFLVDGVSVGTALTDEFGYAIQTYTVTQLSGTYTLTASFAGDGTYAATQSGTTFDVAQNLNAPVADSVATSTSTGVATTVELRVTEYDSTSVTFDVPASTAQGGTLVVVANSYYCANDGWMYCYVTYTYTPPASFAGTDTFTFVVSDGGLTGSGTITITVADPTAPTALSDSYSTDEDVALTVATSTGVLANDSDAEGATLTAVKVSDPAGGTLTLNADGSFTYTPSSNFNGTDSFSYQAFDGFNYSATATVTIAVNPVNDGAPVAVDDAYSTNEDAAITVSAPGVLSNDTDVDGNALTAVVATGPASGTLTLNSDGSFTYTPSANFNGTDSFTYHANDGFANSTSAATVTMTVYAVNDAPSFTGGGDVTVDQDSGAYSALWAGSISAGPSDEAGQTLTFNVSNDYNTLFSVQPAIDASGTLTFTPAASATGTANVTVSLSDDGGTLNGGVDTSAAQTFTITVSAPPAALLGHWTFDDGTGTSAADSSGNNRSATLNGTYTWSTDVPANVGSSGSIFVDGAGYATVSGIDLYAKSFTISYWAKRTLTGAYDHYVIAQGSAADYHGLHIGFRSDNVQYAFWNDDLQTTTTSYGVTTWNHYVFTYDATTNLQEIYVNGAFVLSRTASSDFLGSGTFYIGQRFDNTGQFRGYIDGVRVYDGVLSASEISTLATTQ